MATIQSELQRLSSENVEQKLEIEKLSSENVEQKSELERLSSETDEQNTEITRLSSENVDQNSELEKLTDENVLQQESIDMIDDILAKMSGLPLGSIIPWVNRPNIDSHYTIEDIPDGWQRCDGSVITAPSPWEGEKTPNINGEERFLRGGLDGVQLHTEEDSLQAHTHGVSDSGHTHGYDDKYSSYDNGVNGILGPRVEIVLETGLTRAIQVQQMAHTQTSK